MDCLRSFQINFSNTRTFSTAGVDIKSWGLGTAISWTVNLPATFSTFDLQGFKNIDLYGIKMQGSCQSNIGGNGGVVGDYGFKVSFSGQNSQIGGTFSVNDYSANILNSAINLTKYNPEFRFESPVNGCKSVTINNFYAEGTNLEVLNNLSLGFTMTFIVYYKFEGE